jgi:hypothetical protein
MGDERRAGHELRERLMAQVSFKLQIDPNAVRNSAKRAAGPVMRRMLEQAGEEMVRDANRLMAQRFDLNRPYERRRHPGSLRAKDALDYEITGDPDRFVVAFRVLGGQVVLNRIIALNKGTSGHSITPSGTWELKGARLAVRSSPTRRQASAGIGSGGWLYFPQPEGGPYRRAREVWHPGSRKGTGFLEEARDRAVANIGGRRIA